MCRVDVRPLALVPCLPHFLEQCVKQERPCIVHHVSGCQMDIGRKEHIIIQKLNPNCAYMHLEF